MFNPLLIANGKATDLSIDPPRRNSRLKRPEPGGLLCLSPLPPHPRHPKNYRDFHLMFGTNINALSYRISLSSEFDCALFNSCS